MKFLADLLATWAQRSWSIMTVLSAPKCIKSESSFDRAPAMSASRDCISPRTCYVSSIKQNRDRELLFPPSCMLELFQVVQLTILIHWQSLRSERFVAVTYLVNHERLEFPRAQVATARYCTQRRPTRTHQLSTKFGRHSSFYRSRIP